MAQAQAQPQTQAAIRPIAITTTRKPRRKLTVFDIIVYILLLVFTFTSLAPFIFSFLSSFKTFGDVLSYPPTILPNPWTIGNYQTILSNGSFVRWLFNSFAFAVGVMVFNVLFSSMAGYALARMHFPGRNFFFYLTLAVMLIPLPITMIPKFLTMDTLHLVNTYLALFLPYAAQPFSVFLMVQFLKGLPREVEEAAMIDGASRFRTFFQIVLPLVKPALTAVAILSFQGAWNEFTWSLLVLNTPDMYTLPIGLLFFKGAHFTEYNLLLAGSMFNTIPILIVFFIFQRYFIEGVASAGLKG
ncbi:MAG TPA: carbohydrate ABC transporter permease [Ktedonobacteraceae bacterium]|nr:carbohydrate ABC transporter permease [Ktedonobacteraceae bacterium]